MRCWQFGLFLLFSLVSLDVWAQDLPDIERLLEGNDILNTEDGYEEMVDILSNSCERKYGRVRFPQDVVFIVRQSD